MEQAVFEKLIAGARIAAHVNADYARGYELGARRAHHGIEFDSRQGLHSDWVRRGTRHDPRRLLDERRGYRDGFAGRRANPDGVSSGSEKRAPRRAVGGLPAALVDRIDAAAEAAGISRAEWIQTACEEKLP